MTRVLIAIAGFVAGGAIVTGTAVAFDRSGQPAAPAAALMTMSGMMVPASATTTKKLTIQHVQKGCHVWSDGSRRAAVMRLTLSSALFPPPAAARILHGKEGVDGSSPSEGLKYLQIGMFCCQI